MVGKQITRQPPVSEQRSKKVSKPVERVAKSLRMINLAMEDKQEASNAVPHTYYNSGYHIRLGTDRPDALQCKRPRHRMGTALPALTKQMNPTARAS